MTLGITGLFLMSMAIGLGSWPLGAVGLALAVIAVALLTTASMLGSDKETVDTMVAVVKVSDPPTFETEFGRCEMHVAIEMPGHPGQTVTVRDPRVPVAKWPQVGDRLPAQVGVTDVRRIRILWDQVQAYADREDDTFNSPYTDGYHDPYDDGDEYINTYADGYGGSYRNRPFTGDEDYDRIHNPEDLFIDDNDRYATRVEPVVPDLPRRHPTGGQRAHSIAILEGELVPAEVPAARDSDGNRVDVLDFSDVPEPEQPTPAHTRPVLSSEPVLPTQPAARPAASGSIHGVGVTVMVTDLARSVAFYHDMLGFYEIDSGPDSAVLASGDTRVVLMVAADSIPVHNRLLHLSLEVGDVDAVYEELKLRGVRFTSPPRVVNRGERLELVAAAFKDPDGHGIAITQWKTISS